MKEIGILCAAVMGCAAVGFADGYVTLTAGDASGKTSFTDGTRWSDGLAPHSDADYLVSNSLGLRTPPTSTSSSFGGKSLTLGVLGGTLGYLIHKTDGTSAGASVTYSDLRLVNGRYSQSINKNTTAYVNGKMTVAAPESAPFKFTGSTNRKIKFSAAINGAEGTAISIGQTPGEGGGAFYCQIAGNNANYFGKWFITGTDVNNMFFSSASVGGSNETFLADAILLSSSGSLAGASGVTLAPPNRGVTVDVTGGTLMSYAGQTWTLDMPVTGAGALTMAGDGTVLVKNTWTLTGNLTVTNTGALLFDPSATLGCGDITVRGGTLGISQAQLGTKALTVDPGTFINPNSSGIGTLTLSGVAFNGGVCATLDQTSGATDCLVLDGTCTVPNEVIPLELDTDVLSKGPNSQTNFPVLKIPASIKVVTAADFTNATVLASYAPPTQMGIDVTTDGDGIQTVSIVLLSEVVSAVSDNNTSESYTSKTATWSDGLGAHAGAAYINVKHLIRTALNAGDETFPGDSLVMIGDDNGVRGDLHLKCRSLTINNLTMLEGSVIAAGGANNNNTIPQYLYGNFTIGGRIGYRANFINENRRQLYIGATLSGSGAYRMSSTSGMSYYFITSSNENYTGYMQISGSSSSAYAICTITDETNIGGNPYAFVSNALELNNNGTLAVTNDVTIDDYNRGFAVTSYGGRISVDEGCTLTLLEPVVFNGNLGKVGAGTLAIGNEKRTSNGKTMYIAEGSFMPLTAECVGALVLNFSDGAALKLQTNPEDSNLADYGLIDGSNAAFVFTDNLAVELDYRGATPKKSFTVPLCTVSSTMADALRGHIIITNPPNKNFVQTIVEDTVTYNSGTFVRFSAQYKNMSGLLLQLD